MLVRGFRIAAQNHFASSHLVDFIGVRAGVVFISQHNVVRIFLGECAIFLRGLIFSIIFRILRLIRLNGHCQSGITVGKRVFRIIERRFVDRQSVYAGISAKQFQRRAFSGSSTDLTYDCISDVGKKTESFLKSQVSLEIEHQFFRLVCLKQIEIIVVQLVHIQVHTLLSSICSSLPVLMEQGKTRLKAKCSTFSRSELSGYRGRQVFDGLIETFISIFKHLFLRRTGSMVCFVQAHVVIENAVTIICSQLTVSKAQHKIGFAFVLVHFGFSQPRCTAFIQCIDDFVCTRNCFVEHVPSADRGFPLRSNCSNSDFI